MNKIKEFTEEEIKEISERIDDDIKSSLEDEIEAVKDLKSQSSNLKRLGRLFFECHQILASNLIMFAFEDKERIIEFLEKFEDFDKFRDSVEIYSKDDYGAYYEGERVKDYVLKNTKDIKNLITFFFSIFPED